jgi:anti-anti-sigma regulatory factor
MVPHTRGRRQQRLDLARARDDDHRATVVRRRAGFKASTIRCTDLLLVDMTDVTFFDSSVAHLLLEAQRHAAAVGTRFVALVVDREACGVLDLLGGTAEVSVFSGR